MEVDRCKVLKGFNSKDIYTDNVCYFISDCLLETLKRPVNVSQFSREEVKDILEKKEIAEKGIKEDLKNLFKSDLSVDKVSSVFEDAELFDIVLDSLSGVTLSGEKLHLQGGKTKRSTNKNKLESHLGPDRPSKIYDKVCSLTTGHVDLDMKLVRKRKLMFGKKVDSLLSRSHSIQHRSKGSGCVIKPIHVSPLTPSKFNITNVSAFLNLSSYCGCCKHRLKELEKLYSLTNHKISMNSQVKFNNESSLFKPIVNNKSKESNEKIESSANVDIICDESKSVKLPDDIPISCSNVDTEDVTVVQSCSELDVNKSDSTVSVTSVVSDSTEDVTAPKTHDTLSVIIEKRTTSISEKSPLIVFDNPELLKDNVESVLPKIDGKVDDINNDLYVESLIEQSASVPVNLSPSSKVKENKTLNTVVTSKEILNNIYGKYNENNKISNKTSLREKLDTMIKNDKTKCIKLPNEQKLENVRTEAPMKSARKIAVKPCNSSGQSSYNSGSAGPKLSHIQQNSEGKFKTKISDINPILAPESSTAVKENHSDSKVVCNLNSNRTLMKTICNDGDSSKLVDEYIPLVVLDDESNEISSSTNKRKVILNDDKKKSLKKLAKIIRREKRKKKLLKKAQLDLTPPPGVDVYEFLQQQLENIKQQLRTEMDSVHDEPTTSNLGDNPDLIKDCLTTEGSNRHLHSISNVLHSINKEQNHRKVVDYRLSGKNQQLDDGEIIDSSDDCNDIGWSSNSPSKTFIVKNGLGRHTKINEKSGVPGSEEYDSWKSEKFRGNLEYNSSVVISDDELPLNSKSSLIRHNKLQGDNVRTSVDQESPKRHVKSRSRSPMSYSKSRFRANSPSPRHRRNYRHSPSSRSRLPSPTHPRGSPYYRRRSISPRSPERRKYRSRSITPIRKRHRSRSITPRRSPFRRRQRSRPRSPIRYRRRTYRNRSRSPRSPSPRFYKRHRTRSRSPSSVTKFRSPYDEKLFQNMVKAPSKSNKEMTVPLVSTESRKSNTLDGRKSIGESRSVKSRSPVKGNPSSRSGLAQRMTSNGKSCYQSSYPSDKIKRYHLSDDYCSPVSLESISPDPTELKITSDNSPISEDDIVEEISTQTITTIVEEKIIYADV